MWPFASHHAVRLGNAMEHLFETDLTKLWTKGIKLVLSLLIVTILAALTGGVAKTFLDLGLLLRSPVEVALRQIIIDTLIILAVVELFKTTLTYFSEGRVKVTFIVDTILVVMLTEVISQWFKGGQITHLAILGVTILTLGAMRVLAVRFSPPAAEAAHDVI
ncbi:MAG: phosphate-starvation-inducible PsiE family protein [Nitrospiraceae bacterium]